MRPRIALPRSRAVHAALGLMILGVPAVALAASPSDPPASSGSLPAKVSARRIAYHREVVLTGKAPATAAGQSVMMQLEPVGSHSWRAVATGRVRRDGNFRLQAPLRRSALVRAVGSWSASGNPTQTTAQPSPPVGVVAQSSGGAQPATASGGAQPASSPQRVYVAAKLAVPAHSINVLGSQTVHVKGRLLPGQGGRHLRLQELRAGRWETVGAGRTTRRGYFDLRYLPGGNTQHRLRVRFPGDRANTETSAGAGTVTVYQPSMASWYDDAGATACGFHAYYGVANVSLPCGTKVQFSYHGRSITAVVQDRGPYVAGRTWDLNQNLAGALGFSGVDTVWTAQ